MVRSLAILAGAALVLGAVGVVLARHVYLTLPETIPPDETALSRRGYAAVRAGLVAGGAVGAVGAAVAVVDTLGTISAAGPGQPGAVAALAIAIPEWAASAGLLAGAALLSASALVVLVAELRAWLGGEGGDDSDGEDGTTSE